MAMTGAGLKADILDAILGNLNENERTFDAVWLQVANAIVGYIQAHATVSITGTATGVTAGAASVPVTGSGTIA